MALARRRLFAGLFTFLWLPVAGVAQLAPTPSQTPPPAAGPATGPRTRTIEGRVLDPSGAPVSKAIVLVKNTKTLAVRSYISGKDGSYHLYGMDTDVNYVLRAQANDLTSKEKTVNVFDSHPVVRLDLKLNKPKKTGPYKLR